MNLNGCFAKVQRAQEHLEQLKQERSECLSNKFLRVQISLEADEYVARIHTSGPLSFRISNIVGDVVHNLRSSLDHLACVAVKFSGADTTKKTQFPIAESPTKFQDLAATQIKGTSAELRALFESFQPYHQTPASHHPLNVIHQLDIEDKHKNLLVAAIFPASGQLQANGPKDSLYDARFNPSPPFPLTEGAELVRFRLRPGYSLKDIELQIGLGADLALVEEAPIHGQPLVSALHGLSEFVLKQVLAAFVPIIEQN